MDFLTLEPSKGGQQHILVVTDHFTRYAQAYPTRNMTAKTTADVFFHNFVVHYGLPVRIHSDQGANFEGALMKELCTLTNMQKSRTTPYHAMGNGMCERFNRTLLNMLGTLDPESKKDWKSHVGPLVHAYNSTRHEATKYSPFFLMFGRAPRLPVDLAFGLDIEPEKSRSMSKYIRNLKDNLQQAYELASANAKRSQTRHKSNYDYRARATQLEKADRVLVKKVAFDGKHKLSDKWEEDVYIVIKQPNPSIPVYVVQKERGDGKTCTLHRNLLLPISSLPLETPIPKPRHSDRTLLGPSPKEDRSPLSDEDQDQEEETDDITIVVSRDPSDPSVSTDNPDDRPTEGEAQDSAVLDEVVTGEEEVVDAAEDVHSSDAQGTEQDADSSQNEPQAPEDGPGDTQTQPKVAVPPIPAPRRSTRERTRPAWQTRGDYVMSALSPSSSSPSPSSDWLGRAEYLSSLMAKGVFAGRSEKALDALVNLVAGKQE
ncbi:uncharacterized protein LOC125378132 [Haliotis rufescens]|uniref:uncharacterized protein LOC125378132 n=1 Tax=Haliotis rufescens TaxID=6454 RepID=UPI00201F4FA4|nr:uncharacterized protein LOC125378132 [Haliotis rufescens]